MSQNNTLFSSGQTAGIAAGLNQNFRNTPRAVWQQNVTTNVSVESQFIQSGWSYIQASGTPSNINTGITFPVAFDTAPNVVITYLGRNGSTPANVGDFSGGSQDGGPVAAAISTTGFSAFIWFNSTAGNGLFYGFSWIAIGTRA